MNEVPSVEEKQNTRWNGRIPIAATLAISIGLLMFVAVGTVLGVGVWLAQKNTFNLLSKNAHQAISAAADNVKTHLKPAEFQTKFIADWISRGEIDPNNQEKFGNILIAALAAAPQIEAILFIDTELQSLAAGREDGHIGVKKIDYSKDPVITRAMTDGVKNPGWGSPIWRERFNKSYMYYAHPIEKDGKFIGAIVAIVSIRELSRFVTQDSELSQGTRFLLYGRQHVLAHWLLEDGFADKTDKEPLPRLSRFSDPVLTAIWQTTNRMKLSLPLFDGTNGHILNVHNERYVFLYQNLEHFGPEPIIVGVYNKANSMNEEIRRMRLSLVAGIAALLISLAGAIYVGRRIARPIVRFSAGANQIRDLDVSKVASLPPSIFKELNDQSTSFNAMLQALRWFELYVPKKIVASLIKRNTRIGDNISSLQKITVMFTDIVGFSTTCEGMNATEVADFVNQHFTLIAKCIEDEEGTVDKFIGDSIMAFWGAPEAQKEGAKRACRAALAMRKVLREDNILRMKRGEPEVHIRIGIHTGQAVVGNIGAPDRLNYTIIGDTVNIAQRLEQLGKTIYDPTNPVTILISGETASELGENIDTKSIGHSELKGRSAKVEAFKLI